MQESVEEIGLSTAESGAFYVPSKIVSAVLALLLMVILARMLKPVPAAFGDFTIVLYIVTMLRFSGSLGIGTTLRKMLPGERTNEGRRELMSAALTLTGSVSAAITVAVVLLGGMLLSYIYNKSYLGPSISIAALTIFFIIMFNILSSMLIAVKRARAASVANVANSTVQLIAATALVLLGYGVFGAFAGMVIGAATGCLIQILYALRHRLVALKKPHYNTIKKLGHFAFPIFVSEVSSVWVNNFAVAFLGIFVTSTVIANYGAAYKLGNFVEVLLTSSIFVLIPVFSSMLSGESTSAKVSSIYKSSMYYSLVVFLPMLAYALASSRALTFILFSHSYTLAPLYFAVIVTGSMAAIFGRYAAALIVSYGDTGRFLKYQLIVLGVSVTALFILTPTIGVMGTLLSMFVVAPITLDVVYMRSLSTQFHHPVVPERTVRVVASSVILLAAMYIVTIMLHHSYEVIVANAVIMLALFPVLLAATRGIRQKDVAFLSKLACKIGAGKFAILPLLSYTNLFLRAFNAP
ncbi:MAG: oligosaccharide flippase family protein [Candidatus Marsarchaeota archaeon]|nr:oligosaccharide flippase family protein [Candidatus Marsarchaeota archaeon]